MSSAAPTKIFGMRVGLDPKILVALLIGVAALLFWYNSRSDEGDTPANASRTAASGGAPAPGISDGVAVPRGSVARAGAGRRGMRTSERGTLQLRPVDATHGDVDPTLRLDLLARLQTVEEVGNTRNLFEMGSAPLLDSKGNPIVHPIITPKPPSPASPPVVPPAPDITIPLRYYGFEKPVNQGEENHGFFLDGDNILVAAEGDVLKQRYMVVELTPTTARIEDMQVKKGKRLPLEPEARDE